MKSRLAVTSIMTKITLVLLKIDLSSVSSHLSFSCPAKSNIPTSSFNLGNRNINDSSPNVGSKAYSNNFEEFSPSKKIFRRVVFPAPDGPTKITFLLIFLFVRFIKIIKILKFGSYLTN